MKVSFPNDNNENIAGRLEMPLTQKPKAFAIFAHCFTCSKDVAAASRISRALTKNNVAVLRFDFTGLGNSDGDFANSNFSTNVSDLVQAAQYLRENFKAPQLLIGHSLGGAAVLAAASEMPEVQAVVTIGAPSDVPHVAQLFGDKIQEIEEQGQALVTMAGREFTIKKQFIDDLKQITLDKKIEGLHKALLVFHSPQDNIVSIDHAKSIYLAAKHPKSFVSLDGADHLLTNKKDSEYVAQMIAAWSERYIEAIENKIEINEGEVLVTSIPGAKFTHQVNTKDHELIADEPKSVGGANLGPGPYDFLMMGLGSCTSMTMFMYARHKNINLEKVEVKLRHNKIYGKDCEDCETEKGKIDEIRREIKMWGELTDENRSKLIEIADKCPVHRSLHSEVKVRTEMA